jgi:hypothetical protein
MILHSFRAFVANLHRQLTTNVGFYRLLKNSCNAQHLPSAAEAVTGNRSFIAAVNRCATQKQEQRLVFQRTVLAAERG